MHTPKIGELWAWRWDDNYPSLGGTTEILMVVEKRYDSDQGVCQNIETSHRDYWSFNDSSVGKWKKISSM
jgi:hypothetical protein